MDGYWNGVWGLFRNYGTAQTNLMQLPNGATLPFKLTNAAAFTGICPATSVLRSYDISAVLANDVLGNTEVVTILPTDGSDVMNVGGKDAAGQSALNPAGGTLVYNPRATTLATAGRARSTTRPLFSGCGRPTSWPATRRPRFA